MQQITGTHHTHNSSSSQQQQHNRQQLLKKLDSVVKLPSQNTEAENAERYIQKLRKKLQPKKRESSVFNMKGSPIYNLRMCLHAEEEENFPQCLTPPKGNL